MTKLRKPSRFERCKCGRDAVAYLQGEFYLIPVCQKCYEENDTALKDILQRVLERRSV